MSAAYGIAAALTAPLLEAVGFLEWEANWSKARGSAFALNMFKCNFAALLFLFMTVYATNKPFLDCTRGGIMIHNDPVSFTAQQEKEYQNQMNPINNEAQLQAQAEQHLIQQQEQMRQGEQEALQAQDQINQMQLNYQRQEHNFIKEQRQVERDQRQIEQHQQPQQEIHGRKLEMGTGGELIDNKEYMFIERRKKTPYTVEKGDDVDMQDIDEDFRSDHHQPCPEIYSAPFEDQKFDLPYIVLSSLLGIVIGDCAELEALRLIGARRVLVVDTIKPFAAALIGHILLGEAIYPEAFIGMILTALGVYIVLMTSIEKIEEIKDKIKKGNMKRGEDLALLNGNDDGSYGGYSYSSGYSNFSDDSYGEDAEIISLKNEENNRYTMIGMHRRPLSRHDLRADVEELLGNDDYLVILLEDGNGATGILNTTVSCTLDQRSRSDSSASRQRRLNSGSSWGSKSSFGDMSFSSMGSLEDLKVDANLAMENFESNDPDFFFADGAIRRSPSEEREYEDSKEAVNPIEITSMPTSPSPSPTQNDRPLKSALKKHSRYNLKDNIRADQEDATPKEDDDDYFKNDSKKSPNIVQAKSLLNTPTGSKQRRIKHRLSSNSISGSVVSVETEYGPPPGLYGNDTNRETKTQRKVRLRTGYCLATLNVVLDSFGSYLTKKHGYGMSTWEINLCRLGVAGIIMTTIAIFMRAREWKRKRRLRHSASGLLSTLSPVQAQRNGRKIQRWYLFPKMPIVAWMTVSIGVIFVTFFAPALANYSLFQIPLALSISLCSVTPLYTLPLGIIMKGEKPTRWGYIGAALSVAGVIILCVWGLDSESL